MLSSRAASRTSAMRVCIRYFDFGVVARCHPEPLRAPARCVSASGISIAVLFYVVIPSRFAR